MMKDREIEEKLAKAIREATPDVLDDILHKCQEQKGWEPAMKTTEPKNGGAKGDGVIQIKKKTLWRGVSAIAAAALLCVSGLTYVNNYRVDSIIGIDVNPSIELETSRSERVLAAKALNDDAAVILNGMNLKGVDLDVAVNAVIGSMLKNGYVDDLRNSILISVENPNTAKSAALQDKLSEEVNAILEASDLEGAVLSQTISEDEALKKLAAEYNISTGKAALIQNLLSQDSALKFSDLTKLSITELSFLADARKAELEGVKSTGTAANVYIGAPKAREIALTHVGLAEADARFIRSNLNYKTERVVYDVEFYKGYTEYDFEIDAKSGEILKYDNDVEGFDAAAQDLISEARAKEIALAHAGLGQSDVKFIRAQMSWADTRYVYDVEFYKGNTEYDFSIEAKTGAILRYDNDIEGFDAATAGLITEARAKEIALNHAGLAEADIKYVRCQLSKENSVYVYNVEFYQGHTEYDFSIEAKTGKILSYDNDIEGFDAAAQDLLSESQARQLALSHAGLKAADVTFYRVKLTTDNGKYVYDVEFYKGSSEYDYRIDAKSGEILGFDRDIEGYSPSTGQLIGEAKAKETALNHAGLNSSEVSFTKAKLDYDDGRYVYDVEFDCGKVEYDYESDATSGAILSYEKDERENPQSGVNANDFISKAKAREIAFNHAGVSQAEAKKTKVELDDDDGRYLYEISFQYGRAEYDYDIDAKTGSIVKYDKETDDDDWDDDDWEDDWDDDDYRGHHNGSGSASSGGQSQDSLISADKAKSIALTHAGLSENQVKMEKLELDYDDGRAEYEVEFRKGNTEYEYKIDAASGNILKSEQDNDD